MKPHVKNKLHLYVALVLLIFRIFHDNFLIIIGWRLTCLKNFLPGYV